jgi:genome maintenance exonuclease 1
VEGYYGSEVTLYYPGLYAGSTDLVCIHNGKDTVIDFKQSNRPKRQEWIDDYFLQIAAYCMAHDYVHGSNIEQGIIMVCTPDLYYQEFVVNGAELRQWKHKFLKRLDMYHDLKFDEKEQANVKITKEDFDESKNV